MARLVLPGGSQISANAFDDSVLGWRVTWPEGRGDPGFVPNRGPLWWWVAVARMRQGATVIEQRRSPDGVAT